MTRNESDNTKACNAEGRKTLSNRELSGAHGGLPSNPMAHALWLLRNGTTDPARRALLDMMLRSYR